MGFLLEEYFGGQEVDVDGWARKGKVEFQMVSDNRPAIEPHFLEMGGVYPSQLPKELVTKLEDLTRGVVEAFPGFHGAFHFEAKVDIKTCEVMPIELNTRCGGAECPACVRAVTGYYLPEVAARLALDLPVEPKVSQYPVVASINLHRFEQGVITECSKAGLNSKECEVLACELWGVPGKQHQPNVGSISCLGWMAAGGSTAEEAERNLRKAESQLRITITAQEET